MRGNVASKATKKQSAGVKKASKAAKLSKTQPTETKHLIVSRGEQVTRSAKGSAHIGAPVSNRKAPVSKSGIRLADALVDELADEAQRGYDLSRGRRIGRPSLEGQRSGLSPRVSFRITPALREQANRRAEKEGKTISAFAREALERYLSEHKARK
jgi:predicted HicB family RNase H-like nuclease